MDHICGICNQGFKTIEEKNSHSEWNHYVCGKCGEVFESHSKKANHIRWHHQDDDFRKNYIENIRETKKELDNKRLGFLKTFKVNCWTCKKEFDVIEREFKFPSKPKYYCCKSCANTHGEESTKKQAEKVKELWKTSPIYYNKCVQNLKRDNFRSSSKGEREVRTLLKDRYGKSNVLAHRQIDNKAVDIYMMNNNIIIEYDGIWHFDKEIYERFGSPDRYYEVLNRDKNLKIYCEDKSIRLLRISDKFYLKNKIKAISMIIDFIEKDDCKYKELY